MSDTGSADPGSPGSVGNAGNAGDSVDLSALLTRLDSRSASPTPQEAMAIYTVAVRLVQAAGGELEADDGSTRDVLLGTRRLLRAALEQLDERLLVPPLMVVDEAGGPRLPRRRG